MHKKKKSAFAPLGKHASGLKMQDFTLRQKSLVPDLNVQEAGAPKWMGAFSPLEKHVHNFHGALKGASQVKFQEKWFKNVF